MSVAAQVPPVMLPPELSVIDEQVARVVLAAALGLFLGLEREWSQKSAGIRTFSLVSLLGAVFAVLDRPLLLAIGGALVIVQGILLASRGLVAQASGEAVTGDIADADDADADGTDDDADTGLSLTTSVSMLVAYSLGLLVVDGFVLEAVTVAVISSLLLVLKRELHEFAWGLRKEEVRSAVEFAIIAFVVYPLLPTRTLGPWNAIQPRLVWLLVIAVSGIGFVNYVLVRRYEGRGIAFTGFFGGLVNSTAVIAEMASRATEDRALLDLAVGAILLANAAMAVRNAVIVAAFVPEAAITIGLPLGAIAVAGVGVSALVSDWDADIETELTSPFSLRNALSFGGLFLLVLVASAGAQAGFGATGFITTTFLAGLVSSGTATTTAVTLATTGQITAETASVGVIAGTAASILVKVGLAASMERALIKPVLGYSLLLVAVGVAAGGLVILAA